MLLHDDAVHRAEEQALAEHAVHQLADEVPVVRLVRGDLAPDVALGRQVRDELAAAAPGLAVVLARPHLRDLAGALGLRLIQEPLGGLLDLLLRQRVLHEAVPELDKVALQRREVRRRLRQVGEVGGRPHGVVLAARHAVLARDAAEDGAHLLALRRGGGARSGRSHPL